MQAIGSFDGLPVSDERCLVDVELPVPDLRPHDVLVRVQAVSVNPADVKRRAALTASDTPTVLGYDAAGVVEAIGAEVGTLGVGDEVFYAGDVSRPGSNAELQAVDERIVAERPGMLSFADAAALPLTSLTASEALFDRLGLTRESTGTLLILGAAGGVGSILVQLTKLLTGVTVIGTASRGASRDWVNGLGADAVIDHHDLVNECGRAAPDGIDYVFSPHTAGNIESFAEIMNPFGAIVAIDEPEGLELLPLKTKSIAFHWELMFTRSLFETPDMIEQKHILARVAALVDGGRIRSTVRERIADFSAAGIRRAHELVESGRMTGKVVVHR
jgi:NADPH:quinone reductase